MRIAFAGTPEFARAALSALLDAGHEIALVLTREDRPAGRGMRLGVSPVKDCALHHGLPVNQPRGLRLDGKFPEDARLAHTLLTEARTELMVVAAYGLILPSSVLALPTRGCLNIHASLLPRWRGAAPIERAIEAGDPETGITIMQMDAGLDTGAMLMRSSEPILPGDSAASLRARLEARGAALIVAALDAAARGALSATPQPESGVSYAQKLTRDEAPLDFELAADVLARRIRAFDPVPGASATLEGVPLKIWGARATDGAAAVRAGTIIGADRDSIEVACGAGVLHITELQRPGGKRMAVRQFLQGHPLTPGVCFV